MKSQSIHFIQTSERNYFPLLRSTSRTVSDYCREHDFTFDLFLGICRGYHPWHATYNRIDMLGRIAMRDYDGWVCYMDADALIVDNSFDLRAWLEDKHDKALIIARGGPDGPWWNVNAGVFLINFGHPLGRKIATEWQHAFYKISDEELRSATEWSSVADDQTLLWGVLSAMEGLENETLVLQHPHVINYDGSFIKQILRVAGDFDRRVILAEREVARVLATNELSYIEQRTDAIIAEHIHATYRTLLLREADTPGLSYLKASIKGGLPLQTQIENMIKSPEFINNIGKFFQKYSLEIPN